VNLFRRHDTRPLLDALSILLPDEEERQGLRLLLGAAEDSNAVSTASGPVSSESSRSIERLVLSATSLSPLVYARLREKGAEAPRAMWDRLRMAYALESSRAQEVRRASGRALQVLEEAGVTPIPLRGVVLAELCYPDPALRHCHDLDLLVDPERLPTATSALTRAGFARSQSSDASRSRAAQFTDPSGFPITLHRELFQIPHYAVSHEALQKRTTAGLFLGVPVRLLSLSDMLIHVCGHASCSPGRINLRWVVDAWYLTQRLTDLDWMSFPEQVKGVRLVLPIAVMLRYLRDELAAPIPPLVVETLESEVENTRRLDWEAALLGARQGSRSGPARMLQRCSTGRCRLLVLRCTILPSPACIRWMAGPLPPLSSAKYAILYVLRHIHLGSRYLASRAGRRGPVGAERKR
jgi:hypothetical protein